MSINHIEMLLFSMANELKQRYINRDELLIVGIQTGGVWVAERLHKLLELSEPLGILNISFYRDDFSSIGLHPYVDPTTLPLEVDDRHIILVDDVLHTGRTIRAALNEIFDYGRPASVTLAILIDRNGRELPIQPDVLGCSISLEQGKHIKLCGPDPLSLEIRSNS